jgi:hypothetical protein
LEPFFEVIPKHSAALSMDFLGAPEYFLNPRHFVGVRIGCVHVLRFETMVHCIL